MAERHKDRHVQAIGLRGAAVLAGAALFTKLIGVLQKIPLQNLAGDRVFGIYNAVYPLYQLLTVLATAGLPAAISIVIAQQLQEGAASNQIRGTLYTALVTLGVMGAAAALCLWLLADPIAYWMGDRAAASSLRSLSVALAVVPLVAALRGYIQAMDRMALSAASQVIEQLIRVAVMVAVLFWSLSASWEAASLTAAVMNASAAGAVAALLLLAAFARTMHSETAERSSIFGLGDAALAAKKLFAVALPAVLGAAVVPAMGVVDAFTIPRMLQAGGAAEDTAMAQFGIYSRALPLVQLVVMIAGAAAGALVPRLVLLADKKTLHHSVHIIIRITSLIGAAAAVGLLLLAKPINIMLYANSSGTDVFAIIGCTAFASCILAAVSLLLQVLGVIQAPALLLLTAACTKGALNLIFTSRFGIAGAAFAGLAALSAAAAIGLVMAYMKLNRATYGGNKSNNKRCPLFTSSAAAAVKGLVIMGGAVTGMQWLINSMIGSLVSERLLAAIVSITGVTVGGIIFLAAILKTSFTGQDESKLLGISGKLLSSIKRWQSKR